METHLASTQAMQLIEVVVLSISFLGVCVWLFLKNKKSKWRFQSLLGFMSLGLFFVILVRAFFFEVYVVPTASMVPTILERDVVLVSKSAHGFNLPLGYSFGIKESSFVRGEIIVFKHQDPTTGKEILYLKRVVGVPGDLVHEYGGEWFVNGAGTLVERTQEVFRDVRGGQASQGREIYQEHLNIGKFNTLSSHQKSSPSFYKVPSGHIFVIGDNRGLSYDSRDFGSIPMTSVMGQAVRVVKNLNGSDRNFMKLYSVEKE